MATITARLTKMNSTITGIVLICLVTFIWALMEWITSLASRDYSLYQVVWVRYATHLLLMLVVFAPRLGRRLFATQRIGLQFVRALMMLIMPVSFILAERSMRVGNILSFFWLAPLIIMISSIWLVKERAAWYFWVIAVVGFFCVLVLTNPGGALPLPGVILSLAMGASFGLYLVMTRMLRHEPTLTNLFYTALGVLIPLSLWMPSVWRPLTPHGVLLMALVGLLGFCLLWVLDKTLEIVSPGVVAPFLYSEMVWMVVIRMVAG